MSSISIEYIIDSNTNKESPLHIPPVIKYYPNFILIKSKYFGKPKQTVIIFTGTDTISNNIQQDIKEYDLVKEYDDDNIKIYSKNDELSKDYECEILKQIGYESKSKSKSCVIAGGKRNRRKTKKSKKRKSKKSKRIRRRIS
jgi:hypothetical protein